LDLRRVHISSIIIGLGNPVASTDAVVRRRHGIVSRVALNVLRWDCRGRYALCCSASGCLPGMRSSFFTGHDVDEEVEHVGFGKGRGDVAALKGPAFVLFCVDPGAHGQLRDEDVAAFGEQNWCFSRDHLHFWIRLHHFLDTREGQLMQFVVMGFGFQVVNYVLPVGGEDVFVGAVESLVDLGFISAISTKYNRNRLSYICPGTGVEFRNGRISLSRKLFSSVSKHRGWDYSHAFIP